MCPHITAELWEQRHDAHIHTERWPSFDAGLAQAETVEMVIQVNGKVRDRIEVPAEIDEADMEQRAFASPRIQEILAGQTPRRVIKVPPKLVNIVV